MLVFERGRSLSRGFLMGKTAAGGGLLVVCVVLRFRSPRSKLQEGTAEVGGKKTYCTCTTTGAGTAADGEGRCPANNNNNDKASNNSSNRSSSDTLYATVATVHPD